MALSKALEDLLKQVQDENDRKALQTNFEKYGFFQEKFQDGLRQSDYDRLMNQTKTEREKEQELLQQLDKIEESVNHLKVPASFGDQFHLLRCHIALVRERLRTAKPG